MLPIIKRKISSVSKFIGLFVDLPFNENSLLFSIKYEKTEKTKQTNWERECERERERKKIEKEK